MNIVLVAEESAGAQTLKTLIDSNAQVVAVLTSAIDDDRGAISGLAGRSGIRVLPAELVRDPSLADELYALETDILLNVYSLYVVSREILEAPRIGSFNLHPGPLPQYAGLLAPSWAIYNGEREHGVTLHWMEPEIDTGAVVYETSFPIGDGDTGISVSLACVRLGVPLLFRLLEDAQSDARSIPATPQDLALRRYYRNAPPHGGRLIWGLPAQEIARFVRACDYFPFTSPWGHPRAMLGETEIAVLKASPSELSCDAPPGTVGPWSTIDAVPVATGDRWLLVHLLKIAGARRRAHEVLEAGARLHDGLPASNGGRG